MTDIDTKALEHACQCAGRSVHHFDRMALDLPLRASIVAHARAIEQHEAYKREVSDVCEGLLACTNANKRYGASLVLNRFIIAKPDPLVEVISEVRVSPRLRSDQEMADEFRAAIEARGGRIVWEGE